MQALIEGIRSSHQVKVKALSQSLRPLTTSFSSLSSRAVTAREESSTKRNTPQNRSEQLEEETLIQTHEAARNIIQIVAAEVETEVEIDTPMASNIDDRTTLLVRLEALGLEYIEAWLGAKTALLDKRPDYLRHASVSIRELLDHLLKRLAPSKLVKNWIEDPQLVSKEPCKSRLRYLYRDMSSEAYAEFVAADIACILETVRKMNQGVHELQRPFSDEVIETLIGRIEGRILSLLDIANY